MTIIINELLRYLKYVTNITEPTDFEVEHINGNFEIELKSSDSSLAKSIKLISDLFHIFSELIKIDSLPQFVAVT